MDTHNQKSEHNGQGGRAKPVLTGLVIGGLLGAGTMLLLAPQSGKKTREELQEGVSHMRDQTVEAVKVKAAQLNSKAQQVKADAREKVENLQKQSKEILAEQLDRVSSAAEAGKKALKGS